MRFAINITGGKSFEISATAKHTGDEFTTTIYRIPGGGAVAMKALAYIGRAGAMMYHRAAGGAGVGLTLVISVRGVCEEGVVAWLEKEIGMQVAPT